MCELGVVSISKNAKTPLCYVRNIILTSFQYIGVWHFPLIETNSNNLIYSIKCNSHRPLTPP